MRIAMKSDVGMKRELNEDRAGYSTNRSDIPLMVVCDGVGGHKAGEVASSIAVNQLIERWQMTSLSTVEDIRLWLLRHISDVNLRIYQKSHQYKDLTGMGTTLVLAVVVDEVLFIAHVGDSRAYAYRSYQLKQLTQDHTLVEALVQSGQITKEEARVHPKRNFVVRALGVESQVSIDFTTVTLKEDDVIVLCSDGLSNMLNEQEMKDVLASYSTLEEQADQFIRRANEAGGTDNITVLCARYKQKGKRV